MSTNLKVIHFQRRPRPGANYSIESIFKNLRCRLKDRVDFSVQVCSRYNDAYFSKLVNIIEASFRQRRDVIAHITGEVYFLNLFMRKKNVLLTIHDCRFMERKKGAAKWVMQYLYLKWPVAKSAYIVSVSENTRRDVIKYTSCDPGKIEVIPVSINPAFQPAPKAFNKDCPVVLHIGDAPNKNLPRLIAALKGINCQLVIIGNPGKTAIEKLKQDKTDFAVKSNLSAEELYREYINCDILAFVSTFEGFGMPIVEANCVERVVLTSNISSMPEVAGDAACLVDPFDVRAIREGLLRLIQDDEYRTQLIANGRKNKLRFDGQIIADKYYKIYKEIAPRE